MFNPQFKLLSNLFINFILLNAESVPHIMLLDKNSLTDPQEQPISVGAAAEVPSDASRLAPPAGPPGGTKRKMSSGLDVQALKLQLQSQVSHHDDNELEISHNLPFKPSLSKTKSHGPGSLFANLSAAAQIKQQELEKQRKVEKEKRKQEKDEKKQKKLLEKALAPEKDADEHPAGKREEVQMSFDDSEDDKNNHEEDAKHNLFSPIEKIQPFRRRQSHVIGIPKD